MRRLIPIVLALVTGCSSTPEEDAVEQAMGEVVSALRAKDAAKIWQLGDDASKQEVLASLHTLEQAQAQIPMVWGLTCAPDDKACKTSAADEAKQALGGALLAAAGADDAGRGARVISYLVDFAQLSFDDNVMDGLAARDFTFEDGPPRRVIVHTSAGDIFGFVQDANGQWRSLLVRQLVLDQPLISGLLANAEKTTGIADDHRRAWQLVLDPRTPQGAYNVARKMQSARPPDWAGMFALLEPSAQAMLGTALEKARAAQKKIQGHTAKSARGDAYDEGGIALMIAATSDRDLYQRWAATKDFVAPLTTTDEPDHLDGDASTGDVTVVTTTGKKTHLTRDAEGFWRIADTTAPIERALVQPAAKIIDAP